MSSSAGQDSGLIRKLLRPKASSAPRTGSRRRFLPKLNLHRPWRRSPPRESSMDPDPGPQIDQAARTVRSEASHRPDEHHFDIFEWYPRYQSCQRYFLDRAQHSIPVQALSSWLNILLPFQRQPNPIWNSSPEGTPISILPPAAGRASPPPPSVSLIPYLRRLVATGMDFPGILHGFFGDDWAAGVGPLHEQERRNYFFAAKSGGWASVKKDYDILPLETVPFLRPIQGPAEAEIEAAERNWSEWLAMEDWMVGPRAPNIEN